jgi:hypothetical protein
LAGFEAGDVDAEDERGLERFVRVGLGAGFGGEVGAEQQDQAAVERGGAAGGGECDGEGGRGRRGSGAEQREDEERSYH